MKRTDKSVVVAIIGLIGVIVAAIIQSPIIKEWIFSTPTPNICDTDNTVPLLLFWNGNRLDNQTIATNEAINMAENIDGYLRYRKEGRIFPIREEGTEPLNLYWSGTRLDNQTVSTQEDIDMDGYLFVRTEGYVYPSERPGTIPLKLYWSSERKDYYTVATEAGFMQAEGANYEFVRTEGWICPP